MVSFDPGADYCYITTTGRVTKQPHTIEIWFAAAGDTLYVLAGNGERSDFVRNAREAPSVSVRVAQRTAEEHPATARIVTDAAEDALARRLLLAKYASGDELDDWGRTALPVAFDIISDQL